MNVKSELASQVAYRWAVDQAPNYTAIFLTGGSKGRLLRWWGDQVGTELLPVCYADHMTIKFQPTEQEVEATPIGLDAWVQPVGWAEDAIGQVVWVKSSVRSTNLYPHVTIACAKGVNPVYSNELLARSRVRQLGPILKGVVDYR